MSLNDLSKQIAVPLVVSAITWVGGVLYTSSQSQDLLRENVQATKELSKSVTDLRVQMAAFSEKYVTRDQLDAAIRLAQSEKR